MSNSRPTQRTLDMVAVLLERELTIEQIAEALTTSVKRAKALVNEVNRQKALLK